MKPVGITRVRNESLIIADTITHFMEHCERILLYDDCSEDDTVAIAQAAGGDRIEIIQGDFWVTDRLAEETRHRGLLLDLVREMGAEWVFNFDADERIVGLLPQNPPVDCMGYRLRLFDGYLTPDTQEPYTSGHLSDLPRLWGTEYRDILMVSRVSASRYAGRDQREPIVRGKVLLANAMVRHYGKSLSIEQWESTCQYYAEYFPEPYRSKWKDRKGRAIHTKSDFGRDLYTWDELMETQAAWVRI